MMAGKNWLSITSSTNSINYGVLQLLRWTF